MSSIIIQFCKYLILFLFLGYLFGCFFVFRKGKQAEKQKIVYNVQKVLVYGIHFLGFLCLYQKQQDFQLIGFYLMQVILISGIFMLFQMIYKKCSVLLINNLCMFFVISMIMLTSISFNQAFRQFVFWTIGSIIMVIIPLFLQKGSIFRKFSVVYCVLGIILLGLVVLIGSTEYGAKLNLAIGGLSFQPSEFVKIIFVFFIASMLYKDNSLKKVIITSCLSAVFVLLLVASKDLGGALLYFTAYLIMVFVATKKKVCLYAGTVGMAFAAVAGYFLFSHVRTRVYAWLDPLADIDNKGYQICQSLFGIGTGGWFGLGIGEGLPTKIPIVEKDFIFSAISEEFGGFFAIGLIILCLSTFMMIVNVAMQMKDRFYKLVAIGLATLYAAQVILTIGGAIKFIPSTGVTLPLVSYGGSSLLATLIMFGIIQGLYMRKAAKATSAAKAASEAKAAPEANETPAVISNEDNKEFSIVFSIFAVIFVAMIGYFTYFMVFQSEDFINNDYNKLQVLFEEDVKRGSIITSDGYVIAETVTDENGNEERNYPYKNLFAHVTGYSNTSKTGLEKQLNFTLLRSHAFFMEQLMCEISGEKKMGDTVITTVRYDLQEAAYEALGDYDGAVIAMEPSTGKILAMVSKPDYDPNTIVEDWEEIKEGTSLYNRATQGQYTPGSIFKIFTTLAYIRSNPDTYQDFSYECTGEITINGKTIHCASGKKHGLLDLEGAFSESCNTAYAGMVDEIDEEVFQDLCDSLLFNTSLPIEFESSKSKFHISKDDETALKMDTLIGQGKTLVSPLHMVMIASAICNDGVAMNPTLVEQSETYNGVLIEEYETKKYASLFTAEETEILNAYMRSVVEDGTASELDSKDYTSYGKTGTAQTSSDLDETNAWFIGYAKKDGKEIAIAVVVEDSGSGSKYAVPVAEKIFDTYFK